jgi:hypothetical protein
MPRQAKACRARRVQGGGLAFLLLSAGPAAAHGINIALHGTGAANVTFHYTDGTVMEGAEYRVFAPGADAPVATGQTDARGDVPLQATSDGRWRIEVQDAAGHASRARIVVRDGVPSLSGQTIPDWFVAVSLFLNILLAITLFVRRGKAR